MEKAQLLEEKNLDDAFETNQPEQETEQPEQNDEENDEESAFVQLGSKSQVQVEEKIDESLLKTFGRDYFNGNWLMYGYGCNAHTPKVEKCKCHVEGNTFICVKTLGDDCVNTGHETFRGTLPSTVQSKKNIAVTYVVGNAHRPQSGHWRNAISIQDQNLFVSQSRRYVRDSAQNEKERPKPVVRPTPRPAPRPAVHIAAPAPAPVDTRLVYYYTNYFLGNWNVLGYVCDAHTPEIEVVNVRYASGQLHAVKLLGDNCVKTNQLSFRGNLPQTLWQGFSFPVEMIIGSPEHPSAGSKPEHIEIVDLNTFRIGNHTYYRVMGPNAASPHGVYINMTPMVGHSNFAGPGFVKLNPRRNMRTPVRRFVIVEEETNKPGNC